MAASLVIRESFTELSSVPPEIAEHIVDQLADDFSSLRACSLSWRTWLPRTRYHLLKSIRMMRRTQVRELVATLDTTPYIAPLIRSVTISPASLDDDGHGVLIRLATSLLYHRLPQLSTWNVQHKSSKHLPFCVSAQSKTIIHLRRYSTVDTLLLGPLTFPTTDDFSELVSALPNLRNLTCRMISLPAPGLLPHEVTTVSAPRHFVPLPLVRVTIDHVDPPHIRALLDLISPASLEYLSINAASGGDDAAIRDALYNKIACLSRLRALVLTMGLCANKIAYANTITRACDLLPRVRSPVWEKLELDFRLWTGVSMGEIAADKTGTVGYGQLDRVLSAPAFPHLKTIHITVPGTELRDALWHNAVHSWLPSLHVSPVIKYAPHADDISTHRQASYIHAMVVSPDNEWLAYAYSTSVHLYHIPTRTNAGQWTLSCTNHFPHVQFSPDSSTIAAAIGALIFVLDVRLGVCVAYAQLEFRGWNAPSHFTSLDWAPDSTCIASSGSGNSTVEVWDARTGRRLSGPRMHNMHTTYIKYSPDGLTLASCGFGPNCYLWDARRYVLLRTLVGHLSTVTTAVFDPSGRTVVTGSRDWTARIWDVATGNILAIYDKAQSPIKDIAFFPAHDMSVLVVSRETVDICNSETAEVISSLNYYDDWIRSACLSSGGEYILLTLEDRSVQIWSTYTGCRMARFPNCHHIFMPDGYRLISMTQTGRVQIRNMQQIDIETA